MPGLIPGKESWLSDSLCFIVLLVSEFPSPYPIPLARDGTVHSAHGRIRTKACREQRVVQPMLGSVVAASAVGTITFVSCVVLLFPLNRAQRSSWRGPQRIRP